MEQLEDIKSEYELLKAENEKLKKQLADSTKLSTDTKERLNQLGEIMLKVMNISDTLELPIDHVINIYTYLSQYGKVKIVTNVPDKFDIRARMLFSVDYGFYNIEVHSGYTSINKLKKTKHYVVISYANKKIQNDFVTIDQLRDTVSALSKMVKE